MSFTSNDGPPIVLVVVVVLGIVAIGVAGAASDPDADFEVTILDANEVETNVSAGGLIEVEASVTNNGTERDSQQIHLKDFEADIVDSRHHPPLTLDPGEKATVTLQWWTNESDVGNGTLSVQSNDHTARLHASVDEPPTLDVEAEALASSIEVGDSLEVPLRVTNPGTETVKTTALLRQQTTTVDYTQIELEGGETVEVALSWSPTDEDIGERNLTAEVGLDTVLEHTVTVEQESSTRSGGGSVWSPSADDDEEEEEEAEETVPTDPLYPDLLLNRSTARIENKTANLTNTTIVRITFEEPVTGNVTVEELRDLPNATDPINDSVVNASITVPEAAKDMNATIDFRLTDRNDSVDDEYRLNIWNGTAWNELETETVRENDSAVVTAKTSGFSLFALTTESRDSGTAVNETEDNTSTTTEPATTTVQDTTTTHTEPSTATETPVPTTESETTVATTTDEPTTSAPLGSGMSEMILPGLAVFVIAILVSYFARQL